MYPEGNLHKATALRLRAEAVLFDSLAKSNREWASRLERETEDE
jgi:hypothetical protein